MTRTSLTLLALSSVLAAIGQVLLKVGASGRQGLLEFLNPRLVLGLAMYLFSTTIWIYALSREPLVQVYAFTALTFALVYVGGVVLLDERLSSAGVLGVSLVLMGIFLIARFGR